MRYVGTLVLGILLGLGFTAAYSLGELDRQNEIVYACRDYGKYVIGPEGTWEITCTGPFNPLLLMPEYKPYPKELVDKNKRRRR